LIGGGGVPGVPGVPTRKVGGANAKMKSAARVGLF